MAYINGNEILFSSEVNETEVDTSDKLDVAPTANLFNKLPIEQGSINFLTGAEASSSSILRTDYILIADASFVISSQISTVKFYVIFYDSNKSYLGYIQSTNARVAFTDGGFDGASLFRVRIEGQTAITKNNCNDFYLQFEKNTDIGHYVPPVDAFGHCKSYHDYLKNSRVFNVFVYDIQKVIAYAVKELYVPDEAYKGQLRFTVFRKITNTQGSIALYQIINGVATRIYKCDPQNDVSGTKLIRLFNENNKLGDAAYILVDWDAVPNGASYTGNLGDMFILSDRAFDIANAPTIASRLEESGNYNGDIYADTARIGELTANTIELRRNYSLPKSGTHLSTDIDFYDKNNDIKGLVPYLYRNGEKVGTIVLYDETSGNPYVFLKDGTKKYLG